MRWIVFLYPWLELWSLLALGSRTSAGIALLWVLGAGVLGVMLMRVAGAQTLGHLRAAQQQGSLQTQLLQDDVALAIVGLLLLIPGMVSDALAVLLLIRPLRGLIYRSVRAQRGFQWRSSAEAFSTTHPQEMTGSRWRENTSRSVHGGLRHRLQGRSSHPGTHPSKHISSLFLLF